MLFFMSVEYFAKQSVLDWPHLWIADGRPLIFFIRIKKHTQHAIVDFVFQARSIGVDHGGFRSLCRQLRSGEIDQAAEARFPSGCPCLMLLLASGRNNIFSS